MIHRPDATLGMRHVALCVRNLPACEAFYVGLLGMRVEWQPDEQNLYLTNGPDNLALHQAGPGAWNEAPQRLDHIGFFLTEPEAVDEWYAFLKAQGVRLRSEPRTHRDGARSFYCYDPDGTKVQLIYHPPVVGWEQQR